MSSYPNGFLPQYHIPGAINLDPNECFNNPGSYPNFQEELEKFKSLLTSLVESGDSRTFYKFGDGDYCFLKKLAVGSAMPGKRALGIPYSALSNHGEFVDGVIHNDFVAVELYQENRERFLELYPDTTIDYPAEFGYGLVSNKWLLHKFAGKISLIGAYEKLALINYLMQKQEYQDYLGLEQFNDYVCIPQRFACDDLDAVEKVVAKQLASSNDETRIFLLGIGHVKSGLLHRMKKYKNAVFLDVGSGIDALAGIVDFKRPYMGGWTNYRMREFNYGLIDFLQYEPIPDQEVWI